MDASSETPEPVLLPDAQLLELEQKHRREIKTIEAIRARTSTALEPLNYRALAQEASEFPLDMTNAERINWVNEKLGLNITLTGTLKCPTLMAPIEDTEARNRFHSFAEEYMSVMSTKNPKLELPSYHKISHTPHPKKEIGITHEKFDGYFSTTFFRITAKGIDIERLIQEYKSLPTTPTLAENGDNCRDRALWILNNTWVSIFYREDGTLDPADNGTPDNHSHPLWNRLTGIRYDYDPVVFGISDWLVLSGIRDRHHIVGACFVRNGIRWVDSSANFVRLPVLA